MMKKRFLAVLVTGLFLLTLTGLAQAALTTIGTATYGCSDYKLIYDADGPFGPITWLDYSKSVNNWAYQKAWAAGLGASLTVTLNPGYRTSIDWETGWRLPDTVDGGYSWGYDGTTAAGYNITTSEMGHLYYTELGNKGFYATDGTNPQDGWGLNNTGDFDNLLASWYWSGTEYADNPDPTWGFDMNGGYQDDGYEHGDEYGLAVRSGQVSAVPVPGAIWLLGSGLAGVVALGRRRKGNRV